MHRILAEEFIKSALIEAGYVLPHVRIHDVSMTRIYPDRYTETRVLVSWRGNKEAYYAVELKQNHDEIWEAKLEKLK